MQTIIKIGKEKQVFCRMQGALFRPSTRYFSPKDKWNSKLKLVKHANLHSFFEINSLLLFITLFF